jgi:hypothetical protein
MWTIQLLSNVLLVDQPALEQCIFGQAYAAKASWHHASCIHQQGMAASAAAAPLPSRMLLDVLGQLLQALHCTALPAVCQRLRQERLTAACLECYSFRSQT